VDDILKIMRESGFKPKANVDEDFPAIKGEYRVDVKALKPWVGKESGEKEAYQLELTVTETLSGDKGDGRTFSRFYRVAGKMREWKDGVSHDREVGATDVIESLKALASDIYTLDGAPTLDMSSTEAFEGGFPDIIGRTGYIRAWHFPSRDDADKKVQQWLLKTQKDLRKDSKAGATKDRVPY